MNCIIAIQPFGCNVLLNDHSFGLSLWLIGTVRAEPETVIGLLRKRGEIFFCRTTDRQNKLSQDYWRACFEINFSDRQEGLTVSCIIICDRQCEGPLYRLMAMIV